MAESKATGNSPSCGKQTIKVEEVLSIYFHHAKQYCSEGLKCNKLMLAILRFAPVSELNGSLPADKFGVVEYMAVCVG